MRTPTEYADNLKKHIITEKMLCDCLYSSNKRAKNYRDKAREYRHGYGPYDYEEMAREKMDAYYSQKEKLLSILSPVCIHKEFLKYKRTRIYEYDPTYIDHIKNDDFVWQNCFYDYDKDGMIWFGDIENKDEPIYHYYLFYELKNHSFHSPIEESEIQNYPSLGVVDVDRIITEGHDIDDLLSNQFVKKVIDLIESKDYIFTSTL